MDGKYFKLINYSSEMINNYYDSKRLSSLPLYSYFGFHGSPLGPHIYLQDALLNNINNSMPIKYAGVIKLDPHTVYNWHIDQERRVAINMLLTANDDSHCVFSDNTNQIVIKTTELKYEPGRLYLFNTQYPHMVLNGHSDRWLFSVEFHSDIDYNMVLDWLKENNYV